MPPKRRLLLQLTPRHLLLRPRKLRRLPATNRLRQSLPLRRLADRPRAISCSSCKPSFTASAATQVRSTGSGADSPARRSPPSAILPRSQPAQHGEPSEQFHREWRARPLLKREHIADDALLHQELHSLHHFSRPLPA